jgi:peptide chain release factor 1
MVEVVALAGALAYAGEHRQARMFLGDVVDQLQHIDGLADAGAAEQPDLAALGERADQVDHLDAGFQQLLRRRQFVELRRGLVDFAKFGGVDRAAFVDRAAEHVHHAAQHTGADRHGNALAGAADGHAAAQPVGRSHRNGAHDAVAQLLLDLEGQALLRQRLAFAGLQRQRFIDPRHVVAGELDIDHRANALNDLTL